MIDAKLTNGWTADSDWPQASAPRFLGDPKAVGHPVDEWDRIAVLRISERGARGGPFRIGCVWRAAVMFLRHPIETDPEGRFGMRIGPEEVVFFATDQGGMPVDLACDEIARFEDPSYPDLPVY